MRSCVPRPLKSVKLANGRYIGRNRVNCTCSPCVGAVSHIPVCCWSRVQHSVGLSIMSIAALGLYQRGLSFIYWSVIVFCPSTEKKKTSCYQTLELTCIDCLFFPTSFVIFLVHGVKRSCLLGSGHVSTVLQDIIRTFCLKQPATSFYCHRWCFSIVICKSKSRFYV